MTQEQSESARRKPLNHWDVIAVRRAREKARWKAENEEAKRASLVNNITLSPLFQSKPKKLTTYTLHKLRSFTDSLETYQYAADKERQILQRNNRLPTKEIKLNLLLELTAEGIRVLRKWMFRYLEKDRLEAVANIELTRCYPRIGKPNNRVHFHILTDDTRSKEELRDLFITNCERWGLVRGKDFEITIRDDINNADWYFAYFTKYDRKFEAEVKAIRESKATGQDVDKAHDQDQDEDWNEGNDWNENEAWDGKKWNWKTVLLFRPHTGLHKFREIGKWFVKPKKQIWKEIQAYMRTKKPQ